MALDDQAKLAIQASYAAASRAGDLDALAALSEPGAVVWHNHDDAVVSLAQTGRTLRWLHKVVRGLDWIDVAVLPTPEGFVWRAILTGTAPGGPLRVPTCMVVTLSEAGLISRLDEYLDAAALTPLQG